MLIKVSNKLKRRERRYMFNKRVNRMISTELAKQIQIAIDEEIVEMLKDIAGSITNKE